MDFSKKTKKVKVKYMKQKKWLIPLTNKWLTCYKSVLMAQLILLLRSYLQYKACVNQVRPGKIEKVIFEIEKFIKMKRIKHFDVLKSSLGPWKTIKFFGKYFIAFPSIINTLNQRKCLKRTSLWKIILIYHHFYFLGSFQLFP